MTRDDLDRDDLDFDNLDIDNLESDLQAWIDGELGPEEAERIARAVDADPALAQRARELRAVDDLLGLVPAPRLEAAAIDRIVDRLQEEVRPAWWRRPVPWVAAAAAILIAFGVYRFVDRKSDEGEGLPPELSDYAVIVPAAPESDGELAELKAALEMSRFVETNFLPMG